MPALQQSAALRLLSEGAQRGDILREGGGLGGSCSSSRLVKQEAHRPLPRRVIGQQRPGEIGGDAPVRPEVAPVRLGCAHGPEEEGQGHARGDRLQHAQRGRARSVAHHGRARRHVRHHHVQVRQGLEGELRTRVEGAREEGRQAGAQGVAAVQPPHRGEAEEVGGVHVPPRREVEREEGVPHCPRRGGRRQSLGLQHHHGRGDERPRGGAPVVQQASLTQPARVRQAHQGGQEGEAARAPPGEDDVLERRTTVPLTPLG